MLSRCLVGLGFWLRSRIEPQAYTCEGDVKKGVSTIKTIVVTGASTGIGKACALYLDNLGCRIFAGVRKQADADTLQQTASEKLTPIFMDVTDAHTIACAVQTVTEIVDGTGLAGLVNNAGIAVAGPLEYLPIADFRHQLEVNVIGQLAVTQAFLSLLRQGQGRIINMSSISGRVAAPFVGPYAASKFGLEALTDSLRVELQPWGIEVVSVQPGAIATPIWNKTVSHGDQLLNGFSEEVNRMYGAELVIARKRALKIGQQGIPPEQVAKVVARALTDKRPKTRYLVGQDAKMGALLIKLLPDRLRDWLIMRFR